MPPATPSPPTSRRRPETVGRRTRPGSGCVGPGWQRRGVTVVFGLPGEAWKLRGLPGALLIEASPHTGRTHQIRVHLESLGYPLMGDPIYRKKIPAVASQLELKRQALHAFALQFVHPKTQKPMSWFAPIPIDLLQLHQQVGMDTKILPNESQFSSS